ncbi:L-alanine exporter AlaE [Candidatus Woesearchaeota archaeon]|nr:L-alanine exporter AlaE [Candidatus Woesearchaeota archaeon]
MKLVERIERLIGERATEKLVNNWLYRGVVGGIGNNLFSLSYALNEKFFAGMSWEETGKARLAAAIGNMITGGPYDWYQQRVRRFFGITKESHWLPTYLVDVAAFATGQTPLYFLYLLPTGATFDEMKRAAIFLTLAAPAAGTPQRLTYQFVNKQFGTDKELPPLSPEKKKKIWKGASVATGLLAAGIGIYGLVPRNPEKKEEYQIVNASKGAWTQGELLEDVIQDTPMGPLYRVVIATDKGIVTYPILETPEKVKEMERRYHSRMDGGIGDRVEFSTDSNVFSLDEQVLLARNFRKAE